MAKCLVLKARPPGNACFDATMDISYAEEPGKTCFITARTPSRQAVAVFDPKPWILKMPRSFKKAASKKTCRMPEGPRPGLEAAKKASQRVPSQRGCSHRGCSHRGCSHRSCSDRGCSHSCCVRRCSHRISSRRGCSHRGCSHRGSHRGCSHKGCSHMLS